jgi:prepilin-type N-terminal cleavage/methylation domain-containing protein
MLSPSKNNPNNSSGFTLVELLVAIALFSILMGIAVGGFVNALRSEREVTAMMSAESNVNLALEQMAREMRTGYLFCHSPGSNAASPACECTSNLETKPTWTCPAIEFYNANGEKVDYTLDANNVLERADSAENGGVAEPLTSDNVSVTDLNFTLFGNLEGDTWNPRITITIGVQPNDSTVSWSTANLETTVSARSIDCIPGSSPSQC